MATKSTKTVASTNQPITLELVQRLAPTTAQAEAIEIAFGLESVDREEIRANTKIAFEGMAALLRINEKALDLHFQRLVGSMVVSAHGAAQFYGQKVSDAKALNSRLGDPDADERSGIAGFDSKAERARQFAAETGLQAFSLMAAAEGAVEAYLEITGNVWKPYVRTVEAPQQTDRKAAAAQMSVFG